MEARGGGNLAGEMVESARATVYIVVDADGILIMTRTAKLFANGRSQAVRLPAACRFEGTEVFIRRDPETGDVILSGRPADWTGFLAALKGASVPDDFLNPRDQGRETRDPFAGWRE